MAVAARAASSKEVVPFVSAKIDPFVIFKLINSISKDYDSL
jgi:hypothetical protein